MLYYPLMTSRWQYVSTFFPITLLETDLRPVQAVCCWVCFRTFTIKYSNEMCTTSKQVHNNADELILRQYSFWTSAGFGAGSPPSPAEECPGQSHVHPRVCSWWEWHLFHFWAWPYHAKRGGLPGAQVGEPPCQLDDLKYNELLWMCATHNDRSTLMCDNMWVCLFMGKGSVLATVKASCHSQYFPWNVKEFMSKVPSEKKKSCLTCEKLIL